MSLTPDHLCGIWPDVDWNNARLHALELPSETVPVDALTWILEHPIWSSKPPAPLFDLRPSDVIAEPHAHPEHARRIDEADLRWPLLVHELNGRLVVIDGLHRLARAQQAGRDAVHVQRVTRAQLEASRPAEG